MRAPCSHYAGQSDQPGEGDSGYFQAFSKFRVYTAPKRNPSRPHAGILQRTCGTYVNRWAIADWENELKYFVVYRYRKSII